MPDPGENPPDGAKTRKKTPAGVRYMNWVLIAGLIVIVGFGFSHGWDRVGGKIAAVGLLVAIGTCCAGALIGFIFGIPLPATNGTATATRASDKGAPGPVTKGTETAAIADKQEDAKNKIAEPTTPETAKRSPRYQSNTNLGKTSDWLATALVGASLTQLNGLSDGLTYVATFLAPGLGGESTGPVAAAAIVVYYSFGGFLLGYLWTRLSFPWALEKAEAEFRHSKE